VIQIVFTDPQLALTQEMMSVISEHMLLNVHLGEDFNRSVTALSTFEIDFRVRLFVRD
jgi:hypothetical protein